MTDISSLNIEGLSETSDLEVKLAAGRDGRGQVPISFYETYSAMTNTEGGVILLGVRQEKGLFEPVGVVEPERLVQDIWNELNNREKVSANILKNEAIQIVEVAGKRVIKVMVPRASRKQRPVYIKGDYLRHTYRRNNEGDYRCDETTVKRMLADQLDDTPDSRVFDRYGLGDLDLESLKAYRNHFKSAKPDHPWIVYEDSEFLRVLGGWGKDRESGKEGLTAAGLLMFGRYETIREVLPNYFLDYREIAEPSGDQRWSDRLIPDGTWSGNLYDFYRRTIQKLQQNLKVPFKLQSGVRVEDTPVHEALREALVNTLIHADYSGSSPILIIKRPDFFGFRNPGTMRVTLGEAKQGGNSDCRNRNLQVMFRMIGLGEQAGSGVPKIFKSWKEQHWAAPVLREKTESPDFTILRLGMISLIPAEALAELKRRFGGKVETLDEFSRLVLATVATERTVNNRRLQEISDKHPSDISRTLADLVKLEMLESGSGGRWTYYYFPGDTPKDVEKQEESLYLSGYDLQHLNGDLQHLNPSLQHLNGDLQHLNGDLHHLNQGLPHFEEILSEPVKVGRVKPGTQLWIRAKVRAESVSSRKKAAEIEVRKAILDICELGYFNIGDLAKLLKRKNDTLRNHYISDLLRSGLLVLLKPDKPNHPTQAYHTKQEPLK